MAADQLKRDKAVAFRIPASLAERLKRLAASEGCSQGDWIARQIAAADEEGDTLAQLIDRAEIVVQTMRHHLRGAK